MKEIVRPSLEDLDCFLKALRIYFPEDNIDREIWKELFMVIMFLKYTLMKIWLKVD